MNALKRVNCIFKILIAASFLIINNIFSQQQDAGLWASVNLEYKIDKKLSASFTEEIRLYENISEVGTLFSDIGIEYKLNKHFRSALHYRFYQKKKINDNYSFGNRVYADISYEKKIEKFKFQFRTRIQIQYFDVGRDATGGIPDYYWRNKISLKWEAKKRYEPYISFELFTPLNYPRYCAFDNLRSTLGIDLKINKHNSIDLFYMIQQQFNVSIPETEFILGTGYNYKF